MTINSLSSKEFWAVFEALMEWREIQRKRHGSRFTAQNPWLYR